MVRQGPGRHRRPPFSEDSSFALRAGEPRSTGSAALRAHFAIVFEACPDYQSAIRRLILGPTHWVLEWTMTVDLVDTEGQPFTAHIDLLDVVDINPAGEVTRKDVYVDGTQQLRPTEPSRRPGLTQRIPTRETTMSTALFLTRRTKPGRRDDVERVWRRHMPEAIAANDDHEHYHYFFADDDPDVIVVYQQYIDRSAAESFLTTPAYRAYLEEVQTLLKGPPHVVRAIPRWQK